MLARIPLLPARSGDAEGRRILDPVVVEGMFLTSRQAARMALTAGGERAPDGERLTATVRAYDRRARLRPTPRAVFAGVQTVAVAERDCELRLDGDHRPRSTPSPVSLAAIADGALSSPDVLAHLTFTTCNLIRRRGRRFEHERQGPPGIDVPQLVTVRATEAITLILQVCVTGASYVAIIAAVCGAWPAASEALVRGTVRELVRLGFLLTNILPDDLGDDPVTHLLGRLPATCELRAPLEQLRDRLRAADRFAPGTPDRLGALTAA